MEVCAVLETREPWHFSTIVGLPADRVGQGYWLATDAASSCSSGIDDLAGRSLRMDPATTTIPVCLVVPYLLRLGSVQCARSSGGFGGGQALLIQGPVFRPGAEIGWGTGATLQNQSVGKGICIYVIFHFGVKD